MNKTTTRDEKIKLLNDLKAGKISIQDAIPKKLSMWIVQKDFTVKNMLTDEILSKPDFEKRRTRENATTIIADSMVRRWFLAPPAADVFLNSCKIERHEDTWLTVTVTGLCENTKSGEVITRKDFEKKYGKKDVTLHTI